MMWYVNGLLCRTEQARDQMVWFAFLDSLEVKITPVPRDEHGRYIIPINDPMEQ